MKKKLFDFNDEWINLCNKANPLSNLSSKEKVWYFSQCLVQDVENGGIISFFYNYGADNFDETIKSLDVLEAGDIKKLVLKLAGLFPDKIQEMDIHARNEAIRNWPEGIYDKFIDDADKEFYKLQESFEERIVNFIQKENLDDKV